MACLRLSSQLSQAIKSGIAEVSEQVADIGHKISEMSKGKISACTLPHKFAHSGQTSGPKRRLDSLSTKLKKGKRSLTGFHLSTSRLDRTMYLGGARPGLGNGS